MGLGAGAAVGQVIANSLRSVPAAAPQAAAATAPATSTTTKFCIACGHSIPQQANFCPDCGKSQR
jgi:membrane protease subunit (stomatin/prohibitin family)